MKKNNFRSDSLVNYVLEYLGDRWTLLVIRDLVFEGKKFYKEFLTSEEGIATNVLSDRLKRLENAGIIQSKTNEKQRTQKIYTLTEKGKDLIPILVEIILWSSKHKEGLNVSPAFVKKLATNRVEIVKAIRANVGNTTFSTNGDD
ncbi:MAG TPA: transcriptional regulator [Microscillaceae bacterium]|nr:transcriptional regulator [Microscillaceae bacterium]